MLSEDKEFQVFVKPVGASCNLRCKYCYYLDKKNLYSGKEKILMSDDILERFIVQNIQASDNRMINFSWHGGEPLLAGIDFFRKAVQLQHRHKPSGSEIINGIQTNGTLLNEEWCRFLAEEKFIVGISIDGPDDLHNPLRSDKENQPTLHRVLDGFELLKEHNIIPEILCVVSALNVNYPLVVYNFFKKLGAKYITFLPLVKKQAGSPSGVSRNTVPSEAFGMFLGEIFDEWVEKDIGVIKIQIFEEAARTAFGQEHTLCVFKKSCGRVPVLEHTGDFYSCDHYVSDDYRLGNIMEESLSDLLEKERQRKFGLAKIATLPKYCMDCNVRTTCNGECPKNRFLLTPDGEPGLNYLCSGYKYFFNHCRPFVEAISEAWKNIPPVFF